MIEERCVHCGKLIVCASRGRFNKRYSQHVIKRHGKPKTAQEASL